MSTSAGSPWRKLNDNTRVVSLSLEVPASPMRGTMRSRNSCTLVSEVSITTSRVGAQPAERLPLGLHGLLH